MSNNRTLIGVIAGVVVLCLCLVCVGVVLGAYFFFPQGLTRSIDGEFRGHYTSGFEVASFVPCADSEIDQVGGAWWIGGTAESGFYEQYLDVIGPDAPEYNTVYVVWRGTVSGPGEYGHLGGYTREATVEEVIEMSLDGTC